MIYTATYIYCSTTLSILDRYTEITTHSELCRLFFSYLTERLELVIRTGDDALGGEKFPRPVVLLSRTVVTDDSIIIVLAVPEHTAAEVLSVSLQLTAVEVATGVVAKVIEVL